jgi:NAD(P)-dependent dehydrogenase (short-subunit alcohol dehydrogenase family)
MANRLAGKVAVITGGNSGIGEGTARLFAQEGAKVILMARREDEGRAVEAAIRAEGGEATFIACDVGNEAGVNAAIEKAAGIYGTIDILFNNAGGGGREHFPNESSEEFSRVINTNLNGTLYVSQAVWPHMVEAGGGAIVNMSSVAAVRGTSPKMHEKFGSTSSSYWAAKAGVDAMTRYMAGIGGGENIRVNGVRPGQIMTPQATRGTINDADGGHHAFEGMFELMQMLDGPGYPLDVANLVLFLVSDESRFITSQIIHIDGGTPVQI